MKINTRQEITDAFSIFVEHGTLYNGKYSMMAKPMKSLELYYHYPVFNKKGNPAICLSYLCNCITKTHNVNPTCLC